MPNIEIHGLGPETAEMARNVFRVVCEALPDLAKDMVVSLCNDLVIDQHDKNQPFLRVCTTEREDNTGNLLRALKALDLDIEYLVLTSFISKQTQAGAS